uniref:Uncharacterized protein n=1 Tax=Rhizophora mucronata TaxID=61149 RepID=A0A2P2JDU9_RHIMU
MCGTTSINWPQSSSQSDHQILINLTTLTHTALLPSNSVAKPNMQLHAQIL